MCFYTQATQMFIYDNQNIEMLLLEDGDENYFGIVKINFLKNW
jgi:hypothetical protein